MLQPIACGEQSTTSNLPIESINKQLELLSQLLSSCQDILEDPEVLFLSVCAAVETEQTVADSNSNTGCQQKHGEAKGNCKRHIDPIEDRENDKSTKRIQEHVNDNIDANTESKNNNKKLISLSKLSCRNILTMSVFLDQKPELWVAIIC